jgi:uncharacterized SAM-binding protein YcdF (DUF218 family)
MITDRERFLAVLANGPLLRGDAIVVLGGEDGKPRLRVGVQLFQQMPLLPDGTGADLVISGGLDDGGRAGARTLMPMAMGMGVAPDRIHLDLDGTNTREQAVNVTVMALAKGWKTLILVASPNHLPRAFLTFLKCLLEAGKVHEVRLIGVAACQLEWWGAPEGLDVPRIELLGVELDKCEQYPEHVATPTEGLAYLEHWERVTPAVPAKL